MNLDKNISVLFAKDQNLISQLSELFFDFDSQLKIVSDIDSLKNLFKSESSSVKMVIAAIDSDYQITGKPTIQFLLNETGIPVIFLAKTIDDELKNLVNNSSHTAIIDQNADKSVLFSLLKLLGKKVQPETIQASNQTNSKQNGLSKPHQVRFRRLIEGLSQNICAFSHTPEGVFQYLSPNFKSVFGFDPDEFIGKNWRDLSLTEDSIKLGNEADKKVIAEGSHQTVTLLQNRPNGEQHFIEIVYGPVYENNELIAMEGACVNVTNRIKSDNELKESYRFLETLMQNLSGMVYRCENIVDWPFSFVSAGCKDLTGYEADSLLSGNPSFGQIIHPQDCEYVWKTIQSAVEKHENYELNYRIVTRDNQIKWFWERGQGIFASDGKLTFLEGFITDITRLKIAESTLRDSEQKYREIFSSTSEAIFIHHPETGKILDINEPTLRMYGYDNKEEFLRAAESGMGALSANFPPYTDQEAQEQLNAARVGKPRKFEWLARKKDGEIFEAEVSITRSVFDGKERLLAVVSDISERKKFLENAQRTDKLESIGLLAGGIAHDFNNLLGGIYGYIELAIMKSTSSETTRYLDAAIKTMNRAKSLTQQLLTFSKGGAPDRRIDNLQDFIKETVAFALSGANVSCSFSISEDLWACNFDRSQIAQVVDNIVINAVQAMPTGGNIEITAKNKSYSENEHASLSAGRYVLISVKDQGMGIGKNLMKRIFDPFFSTKSMGHGLGLTTCHSIVGQHGGVIEVDSAPGQGSTFTIILPAANLEEKPAEIKQIKAHQGSGLILIMDDEIVVRETVKTMLETFGYKVVGKENGEETLDFFKQQINQKQGFAALIFDLTIPGGMGGLETIAEIRKLDNDVPVLVMSGYSENPVMNAPERHGFNGSIRKPFSMSELSTALDRLLKKRTS
jgi:PAS domain S-box-containing protein